MTGNKHPYTCNSQITVTSHYLVESQTLVVGDGARVAEIHDPSDASFGHG